MSLFHSYKFQYKYKYDYLFNKYYGIMFIIIIEEFIFNTKFFVYRP